MDLIVTYLFQGPSLVTVINALTFAFNGDDQLLCFTAEHL